MAKQTLLEGVSRSSKWKLRSKGDAQGGIEDLWGFQDISEREEVQGHRGPERLKEASIFIKHFLGRQRGVNVLVTRVLPKWWGPGRSCRFQKLKRGHLLNQVGQEDG